MSLLEDKFKVYICIYIYKIDELICIFGSFLLYWFIFAMTVQVFRVIHFILHYKLISIISAGQRKLKLPIGVCWGAMLWSAKMCVSRAASCRVRLCRPR